MQKSRVYVPDLSNGFVKCYTSQCLFMFSQYKQRYIRLFSEQIMTKQHPRKHRGLAGFNVKLQIRNVLSSVSLNFEQNKSAHFVKKNNNNNWDVFLKLMSKKNLMANTRKRTRYFCSCFVSTKRPPQEIGIRLSANLSHTLGMITWTANNLHFKTIRSSSRLLINWFLSP